MARIRSGAPQGLDVVELATDVILLDLEVTAGPQDDLVDQPGSDTSAAPTQPTK